MSFALWPRQSRRTVSRLCAANRRPRDRKRACGLHKIESLEKRFALTAELTTTPITWEVIGLDSNKPLTSGPNEFLIAARITNTGTEAVNDITATMSLGDTVALDALDQWVSQATTYITANGPTTSSAYTLQVGESVDVFFGVQIARDTNAYDTARRYDIVANGTATTGAVSDGLDGTHQLYVEKLVSQNRNATSDITVTRGGTSITSAQRGDLLTITHRSASAPGGYEQMTNELLLTNSAFEIVGTPVTLPAILPTEPLSITPGVLTTFSTDDTTREGSPATKFYLDAAGWQADPGAVSLNSTYRSTLDTQKAGGTEMVTTYQVRVRDTAAFGDYNLTGIIYDFSGSSYHYNSDYGVVGQILTISQGIVVGDRVWVDSNRDGVQDASEPGMAGVTVELYRASDNTLVATVVTDGDGNYSFTNADGLEPDTAFYVTVVAPSGYAFTTANVGADDAVDSDVDPATGSTDSFVTSQDATIDRDAGLYPVQADLSITKSDLQATDVPGSSITYTIVVSNAGPDNVVGAAVNDAIPAAILDATWIAEYSTGSSGAASGTGALVDVLVDVLSGGTATFTVTGAIDPAATGTLSNTATVTAPSGFLDPDTTNNTATDDTVLVPTADLSIDKSNATGAVVPGDETTYTITVSNAGPSTITGAVVEDVLPAGTEFVSATAGAVYDASTNTVRFTTGTLAADETSGFQLTLLVTATLTGSLSNTATVTAPAGVIDPDAGNNSSTDTDSLGGSPDLTIAKSSVEETITAGQTVVYTLEYANVGTIIATGVVISDTLPEGMLFDPTQNPGWLQTGPALTYAIGDVPMGSNGSAKLTLTAASAFVAGQATISNTASIFDDGANGPDLDPSNNADTEVDQLDAVPDLSLAKSNGRSSIGANQTVTYTLDYTNSGTQAATGVVITDTLPEGLTFNAAANPGWTLSGTALSYTIRAIAP